MAAQPGESTKVDGEAANPSGPAGEFELGISLSNKALGIFAGGDIREACAPPNDGAIEVTIGNAHNTKKEALHTVAVRNCTFVFYPLAQKHTVDVRTYGGECCVAQ